MKLFSCAQTEDFPSSCEVMKVRKKACEAARLHQGNWYHPLTRRFAAVAFKSHKVVFYSEPIRPAHI